MSAPCSRGQRLAVAAAAFIGTRFRLHGRCPNDGMDCIGLVACSLEAIGENPIIPLGYGLRNTQISQWVCCAERSGLSRIALPIEAGDILLTKPGPCQNHLLIARSEREAIHAHAGLRRVVRQPLASLGDIQAQWRLR